MVECLTSRGRKIFWRPNRNTLVRYPYLHAIGMFVYWRANIHIQKPAKLQKQKKNAMKKKDSESCNGSNDMVFKLLVLLLDLFVWIPPMTIVCYLLIYDYPTWLNDILGEYATTVLIWHEHIMDSGTGTAFLIALKVYLYASLIAGMPFIIIGAIVELLQNYSWRRRTNKSLTIVTLDYDGKNESISIKSINLFILCSILAYSCCNFTFEIINHLTGGWEFLLN